ncbi:MAG TPA: aminopeptidase P family protein [Desulfatirhabdiaceae bacterium]|nr:aminopeptidase P family protein [Desulfatirhabdiaceae bacterium]
MKYEPIDPHLFIENRNRLKAILEPGALAVFNSNDILPTNADGLRRFIQNSDLFYLSGIDQEESILVLFPDSPDPAQREILFIQEINDSIATWQGGKYTKEEASLISGIQTVHWVQEFTRVFKGLAFDARSIWLNSNEHLRAEVVVESRDMRFAAWCKNAFPLHRYDRLAPLMHHLRAVKSAIEIDLIRRAIQITENAFRRVLKFIRPGIWEFEIEAEITHEFLKNRSNRSAFLPIMASGPNSCVLHYEKNNRQCQAGELILMDFGAEYANYASDVTRTVPVSGRFSPRQKAVYNAVLRVQRAATRLLIPGATMTEYLKNVGHIMEAELISLGLLESDAVKNQPGNAPLYKRYFMHGISHLMGIDVHDVGNRYRPFEAGMVFTCEPGIYIREEGFGIRLENDILITADDPVDLTADIPVEPEEIEELMNS